MRVRCPILVMTLVAAAFASGALGSGSLPQLEAEPCSATWESVPLPKLPANRYIMAVAAVEADDVWAVGSTSFGDRERPLAIHWNGSRWEVVAVPGRGELNDVAAIAANDVWAVGTTTSTAANSKPLILHWGGLRWSIVSPAKATSTQLEGVAIAAQGDIWAVGGTMRPDSWVAHIEHWNGQRWRRVSSAQGQPSINALTAISARDIWAVGGNLDDPEGTRPGIQHWAGRSWSVVRTSPLGKPNEEWSLGLGALSGTAANNVWAVGHLLSGPLAMRWDGRRWREVPIPYSHWRARYENRDNSWLFGVAAIAPDDVWAVGFGIEHWDGRRWTHIKLFGEADDLFDIAAVSATDIWAVGWTQILHYACST